MTTFTVKRGFDAIQYYTANIEAGSLSEAMSIADGSARNGDKGVTWNKSYVSEFDELITATASSDSSNIEWEWSKNSDPWHYIDWDAIDSPTILFSDQGENTVMLHGVDANGEHVDGNEKPHGWCVWVRVDYTTPREHGETFGSLDEYETKFQTLELARLYANAIAPKLDAEIEEY